MKLLEQTVRELKGEEVEDDLRAAVNLRVDLKIEEQYIPDMNQRLMIYRQMASARRDEELERTLAEVRDRYGPLPPSVLNLADYGRIRIMADRLGVESVDREGQTVVFRFRPQARLDPERLVAIVERRADVTLVPPAGLRLDLRGGSRGRGSGAGRPAPAILAGRGAAPAGPRVTRRRHAAAGRKGTQADSAAPASWWTARATTGDVEPGFTKAESSSQPPKTRGPSTASLPRWAGCSATCSDDGKMPGVPAMEGQAMIEQLRACPRRADPGRGGRGHAPRRDPRADHRQGERRHHHQDGVRAAPGLGAAGRRTCRRRAPHRGAEEGDRRDHAAAHRGRRGRAHSPPARQGPRLQALDEQFKQVVDQSARTTSSKTSRRSRPRSSQEGMTMADLRRSLEKQMIISRVQGSEVMQKVGITEEEAREYHADHIAEFTKPGTVTLREIQWTFRRDPKGRQRGGSKSRRRPSSMALRTRVWHGEAFEKLAGRAVRRALARQRRPHRADDEAELAPALQSC